MTSMEIFLKTILRSGVLERQELQKMLSALAKEQRRDPRLLAEHLIHLGKLSRFQADKLLQGAWRGLRLEPYVILAPIGRGGMGTVFLARDTRNQLHVALKILPPKKAREEERHLARFRREMDLSQRVSHPHIAFTYEVGVSQGVYFIAMEYIPGVSLYRLVSSEGPLSVPRAARLFAEVALALEHAHAQGLIHRDLKPSNIMVTPNDHAKVLDLGLALIEGETSGAAEVVGGQGYVVGTMDYIAPEQTADATAVDARSDIYSLGCALYFTLTGRPPFAGGSPREKIMRHRQEEPVPLRQVNPAVPEGFAALVQRAMAKEPVARFPSAAALREELLPWAQTTGEPPVDQPGDARYQAAVAALEFASVPAELLNEVVISAAEEERSEEESIGSLLEERERKELGWLLGGMVGFWVIVLIGLALVWLLS